ncbi:MAG: PhoU domain-containing protein [Thermoplasmatota archaeon]
MLIRRVQITGGSSFTISLPKDWVRSQGIEKNSPVELNVQSDGTLLVNPNVNRGKIESSKMLDLDKMKVNPTFRLLVGAYVMGYSKITIRSENGLPAGLLDTVTEFTQKVIGPEIIEETANELVIKDLLNPTKMPFEKTLERMYILVRYMHIDAINALVNDQISRIKDMEQRDMEVDRLNWLLAHQYNIINESNLNHKLDLSKIDSEFYFVTGKILERIGDHSLIIAKNSKTMMEFDVPGNIKNLIADASQISLELLDMAMSSWFHKELEGANETVEKIGDLKERCLAIEDMSHSMDREMDRCIGRIEDSILRTGEYSTDIAENAINYLILRL